MNTPGGKLYRPPRATTSDRTWPKGDGRHDRSQGSGQIAADCPESARPEAKTLAFF